MEIDYLIMLSILELKSGKSIRLVDSVYSDVAGIKDITAKDICKYLSKRVNVNLCMVDIDDGIKRLISKGHISINDVRITPSLALVQYFVEILQYEDDINESLRMLNFRMNYQKI